MSLFQTCEWWSAPSDTSETYDVGSLVVCNIDNEVPETDKVITGSLEGTLRIFSPQAQSAIRRRRKRQTEDGKDADDDSKEDEALTSLSAASTTNSSGMLYEEQTGSPILQLLSGRLHMPTGTGTASYSSPTGELPLSLAILHPHKLVICIVQREGGVGVTCSRVTEHVFSSTGPHFTAANMALLPMPRAQPQAQAYAFGAPTLDSIAVQSLDGQICVFEGSRFVSRTSLPGILLPAPLASLPQQGVLVSLASDMVLHGHALAGILAAKAAGGGQAVPPAPPPAWSINVGEHSSFLMTGGVCKGTAGMAQAVGGGQGLGPGSDVVVLGARTMFVLSHTATVGAAGAPLIPTMRLQRRLGFAPVAASMAPAEGQHNILLVSPKGVLHAFRETTLVWAARLPFIPCALSLGSYGGTPGLLTLLSPRGEVAVLYLGTEPPAPGARLAGGSKPTSVAEYMRMQSETVKLQAAIKSARDSAARGGEGGGVGGEVLSLAARVPDRADPPGRTKAGVQLPANAPVEASHALHVSGCSVSPLSPGQEWERWEDAEEEMEVRRMQGQGQGQGGPGFVVTIQLDLQLTAASNGLPLRNVSVSCHAPAWTALPLSMRSLLLPWVGRGTGTGGEEQGTLLYLPLKARRAGMPTNEPLTVTVSYTPPISAGSDSSGGGAAGSLSVAPTLRVLTLTIPLPACLGMRVQPPVKTAAYKLTVDINRPSAPPLSSLFSDLLQSQPESHTPSDALAGAEGTAAAVLSFAFSCGGDVTLLTSKSAGRIRVQSGTVEGLLPGAHALCARLLASPTVGAEGPPLLLSTADALPMADIGQVIDEHLAARQALMKAHAALADRAQEYRLVAKRLLVRFKDRNPAPLGGLDVLLEAAAQHVQAAGQAVEDCKSALIASSGRLSSVIRLLHLLLPLKYPHLTAPSAPATALPMLLAALPVAVTDAPEGGWEETTEAALSDLLKGQPGGQGGGSSLRPSSLSAPEDSARLKRVLGVLVDRLGKGWLPSVA